MIYQVLKAIIKLSLAVFFKKMVVSGRNNIPESGPVIIVANHPNTFMDPLIIAALIDQKVGFVANASIFSNKVLSAVFRYFNVIPIFRKKDVTAGDKPDNAQAFEKCHEYLNEGKTFLIFPEGSSYYELNLREIKTGTARIALSFEKLKDFNSDLKILPVALDYSDSIQFRSMVSVTINPPIAIVDYKHIYLQDEFEGVKQLTENIREVLAKNIPQTSGKEQEVFLIKAHKFYTAYYEPNADLYENPKRSLELRKQLSDALHFTLIQNTKLYQETQSKVLDYFNELKAVGLTTGFFSDTFLKKNKAIVCLGYLIIFILLLPFYIAGLLTNYLPYILPSKIYESLKIDITYKTPVQMCAGLFTFPFFYSLAIWLFRHFVVANLWSTLLVVLLLPACGYITMYYWTELQRFVRIVRFYFIVNKKSKIKILQLRDHILSKIEEARKSFVQE